MDDKPVFSTTQAQNTPQTPAQSEPPARVTLHDLYGPSNVGAQPVQSPLASTTPQESIDQSQPQYANPTNQVAQETELQTPPPIEPPPAPPPFPPTTFPFTLLANPKAKLILSVVGILLLIIIFIVLFGLNKGGGGANEKVTLTYWGLWDDSKTVQPIINDFQRANPNITVVYKKETVKQYKDRVTTRITNGTGPDIFTYHNTWTPAITTILAPLSTDAIAPDVFKKSYFPVVQSDLLRGGAIYGLPQGIDTISLFINKQIFDAAGLNVPQDWDEFVQAAKTLTVKDARGQIKTAGSSLGTYDNIKHAPDIISLLFMENGVKLDELAKAPQDVSGALNYYTDYAKDRQNVWDDSMNPSLLAFSNGQVAMYFGYSWDIFQIKANNPTLSFAIYPVPNVPGKKITVASYWVNGVSNKSKHQKQAMLFMHYLAQKEVMQKLYAEESKTRLFGTPYAQIELAKTLESNPLIAPFVQQASFAKSSFFSSDTFYTDYNERLNSYLGNAIRSVVAHDSSETAAATLIQGVSQVRSQFGLPL